MVMIKLRSHKHKWKFRRVIDGANDFGLVKYYQFGCSCHEICYVYRDDFRQQLLRAYW